MVIDHYPPLLGGSQLQTQRLSHCLLERGYEVSVATMWQTGMREQEDDGGVQVYRLKGLTTRVPWFFKEPGRRRYPPPFPDPGLVMGLRRLIERLRPDVVHVCGWTAYSCAVALLGKRIPMVVTARDYTYSCANRYLMRGGQHCDGPRLLKCVACASDYYGLPKAVAAVVGISAWRGLLIRKTRVFHSVSIFVQEMVRRDVLQNRNADRQATYQKVHDVVIHDIYKDAGGAPDPAFFSELPQEPFILFVGTLEQRKGLDILLAAYAKLEDAPPLVLIGITSPNTPQSFPVGVTVLRNVPHPTVMAAWERALFAIVPSVWPDPLPNVVLEAMSKGKAVIGTNVGGIPDMIVHGETGLLIPSGDADALAKAMKSLIDDGALRQRLGSASLERARLFAPEEVVPRFEQLYSQLLNGDTG